VWLCGNGQTSPFAGRHVGLEKRRAVRTLVAARRSYGLVASLRRNSLRSDLLQLDAIAQGTEPFDEPSGGFLTIGAVEMLAP